jgi:hypothetical protein
MDEIAATVHRLLRTRESTAPTPKSPAQRWREMEERSDKRLLEVLERAPKHPPKPPYEPMIEPTIEAPPIVP